MRKGATDKMSVLMVSIIVFSWEPDCHSLSPDDSLSRRGPPNERVNPRFCTQLAGNLPLALRTEYLQKCGGATMRRTDGGLSHLTPAGADNFSELDRSHLTPAFPVE